MILMKLAIPGLLCASLISGCSLVGIPLTGDIGPATTSEVGSIEITPDTSKDQSESPAAVSTLTDPFMTLAVNSPFPVSQTQTSSRVDQQKPCNLATAGIPLDVTIPDDSRLEPDQPFSKIWRLVNSGSCTWSTQYAAVYFSGDDLGANRVQPIISAVGPGESVDFTIDMVAPSEPGLYSGFWMLRSDTGELFGIGPNGNSPFWVRIQVIALTAPEPAETVTPAPTPIVLVKGKASLEIGMSIDLDSGKMNPVDGADGTLERLEDGQLQWKSQEESRFAIFGLFRPGEIDCRLAALSDESIMLEKLKTGSYLCYLTGSGLPGMLQIEKLPVGDSPLEIDFTTWAIP